MTKQRTLLDEINWANVFKGLAVALSGIWFATSSVEATSSNDKSNLEQKFKIHEAVDSVDQLQINEKLNTIIKVMETTNEHLNELKLANARIEGKLEQRRKGE